MKGLTPDVKLRLDTIDGAGTARQLVELEGVSVETVGFLTGLSGVRPHLTLELIGIPRP